LPTIGMGDQFVDINKLIEVCQFRRTPYSTESFPKRTESNAKETVKELKLFKYLSIRFAKLSTWGQILRNIQFVKCH
jgi:hypothetical protein